MKRQLKKAETASKKPVTEMKEEKLEDILAYAKETASLHGVNFDELPPIIQKVMLKSEDLSKHPNAAIGNIIAKRDKAKIIEPIIHATDNPSSNAMVPVWQSYPKEVQLYYEDLLEKGWYDKVIESKNISDEVKYHITNAVNNLVSENVYISFMSNYRALCYSMVERFCKLASCKGIDIDPTLIITHPEFKKFISGNLDARGILEYVFNTTPIPVVVHYYDYDNTEYETIPSLHQLNDEEFEAVAIANSEIKAKTFTLSFYNVFNLALTHVIHTSDSMNHYIDLSVLLNYCMSYASMAFCDFEQQVRMLLLHPFTASIYNSYQSAIREGLVFELEE